MNLIDSRVIALTIAIVLVQCVGSVDIESAKEMACTRITKTAPTDEDWMMSVRKWYYPHMNRFDLYSTAVDLTKKDSKDITEDEIYYKGCIYWVVNPGYDVSFTDYGFGSHKAIYKTKPLDDPYGAIEVFKEDGTSGIAYTTLTDNKTFTFTVLCLKDSNQMAWGVGSPYKSLPKETVQLIHDHAESLGFKREHFTSLRYDSCPRDDDDDDDDDYDSSVSRISTKSFHIVILSLFILSSKLYCDFVL